MKKKLLLFPFILMLSFSLQAQTLISSTFLESRTKQDLIDEFNNPLFQYGVELYKITYTTPDVHGVQDTASGLLVIPDDPTLEYPLLCYQHGTIGDEANVPSNISGGYEIAVVFGGMGYVSAAPDLLGLGDARGFHPYVHAQTEASAAIDMLFALRTFAAESDIYINDQVFITGYSQGGHAAMALHREIEQNYADDFKVTASAPMSGPYSISEIMLDFTLGEEEYFFVAYLPYVALSYQTVYGNLFNDLEEVFKPGYATLIQQFWDDEINLWTLNEALIEKLTLDFGASIPKNMLQADILNSLFNDPNHPMSQALALNDVYDWAPQAVTRLFYCEADDQVSFQNALLAEEVMNANGATDVAAISIDPNANHVDCVNPAVIQGIFFFAAFQQVQMVLAAPSLESFPFEMYPNPASNQLVFNFLPNNSSLTLRDISGKIYLEKTIFNEEEVDISTIPNGLFFVEIIAEEKVGRAKILIQK